MAMTFPATIIAGLAIGLQLITSTDRKIASRPTILLSVQHTTIHLEDPLVASVKLDNTTHENISLFEVPGGHQAEVFYGFTGLNSNGQPIPRTVYGKDLERNLHFSISRTQKSLAPGQVSAEYTDLMRIFNLKQKGIYTFQAHRANPLNEEEQLKSNKVTIKVE